jgi:2'-5' RNA ligase
MPNFAYADAAAWKDWQRAYRFGAFFIFPPDGTIGPIDELRRRYDPESASICQAHISLSEPLGSPLTGEHLQELRQTLTAIQPFDVHYGPLHGFPSRPGVMYGIQPKDTLTRLRSAIHMTPFFKGVQPSHRVFMPHMTIAEFINAERTTELLQELSGKVPEGTFPCHSVEYAVPNQDFYFERVAVIPLGTDE